MYSQVVHEQSKVEVYDLNAKIDTGKLIDAAGAGTSLTSPGWLTQLGRLWGGKSVRMHARPGQAQFPGLSIAGSLAK